MEQSIHMEATDGNKPSEEQFWESYHAVLKTFRVPDKAAVWYRRHIQEFIDHHPHTRLRE